MKAVAVLLVVIGLFSASQASLVDDLKEVGTKLASDLVEKGKDALKGVLSGLLDSIQIGKRSVIGDALKAKLGGLVDKVGKLLDSAKDHGSKLYKAALDKLHDLTKKVHEKIGSLKDAVDVNKAVDTVVDDHNTKQKRLIAELLEKGKGLLSSAVGKVKDTLASLKAKASSLVSGLLQKGSDLLVGKRALTDHLKTIGNALSSAVSPFKDIVAGLGTTLKGHFSNLVDTVKGHAKALKNKLAGHVDDLKDHGSKLLEHGKNAVGALSEVVKDILQQTLNNAKPHIDGAAKTVADAGKTVLGHLTGSDSSF